MKFVDRKRELERLKRTLTAPEAQLIVVYGRRRVGKSTLIKMALKEKLAIYFQADETEETNQLLLLAKAISVYIPGFDNVNYPNWYALLEALNFRIERNSTLCLDEFPYLVKSCPSLPSIIQNFWDNGNPRFNLILCGSSQRTMYSELLNEKSPLYGRSDCTIKLQPISVAYMAEAMDLNNPIEAIEYYAVWGGIPRYWKLCKGFDGFEQSFRELMLEPDGTLTDESNRLLRDGMRDLILSRTILSIIGDGANRMSEIAGRLGRNASEISGMIKRLVDMGYVKKEVPFGDNPKNGKKTLYKINDPYLNSYFNFVSPNDSLISLGRSNAVWNIIKPVLPTFIGSAWEEMCRQAVSGHEIFGDTYGVASRWWGTIPNPEKRQNEEIEIDVIAKSMQGEKLLVGECKWTNHEDGNRILAELKAKTLRLPFLKNFKSIQYLLFLKEEPLIKPDCPYLLPSDIIHLSLQEE